jgi:DNA-binding MarR family transcriptional regulator
LRALRLAAQETQAIAGVSAAQVFVLRSLADGADASVSELAERTMTDRSSVASVVERLINARLVSRTTSEFDRRRAAITITAKGRAVLRKAPKAPTTLVLDAIETMSARDLKALAEGLTALVEAMGLEKGPAYMLFEDKPSTARRTAKR